MHTSTRTRLFHAVLIAAVSGLTVQQSEARISAVSPGEARVADCIRIAAQGKPWLEKTLWGLRDQEGGWIGAAVLNTNGSHDLGPLQVNTWWVPRLARLIDRPEGHVRHWLRNDPCFNAEAARWIFLSALAATGSYWEAIGTYHSPTPWRQQKYARSVATHLRARFGTETFWARPKSTPSGN